MRSRSGARSSTPRACSAPRSPSRGAGSSARGGARTSTFPGRATSRALSPAPPDVVHLHNLHGGYFDLRELPALSRSRPVLLTMHDAWLLSGHCAHSFACGRWETGCGACPALWIHPSVPRDATALNWERKRALFARSALHVAVSSHWMADRVRRSILAPAVRELRVIPFGVNVDAVPSRRPAGGAFRPRARSRASRGPGARERAPRAHVEGQRDVPRAHSA